MAKKKLSKEELEQDPLLDAYISTQTFYQANKSMVIGVTIAIILVVGGGLWYYYYSQNQEEQAQQLMAFAEQKYMNGNYEEALYGSESDFTVGFEQIINNYSITDAANLAHYYAAVCEFNLGNPDQALEYIKNYSIPDGILGVGPISFHGVILAELGRYEEAAAIFVKAANWNQNEATTPYNLLKAANAYLDSDVPQQAEQYAERIITEYPDSQQATEAQRILGMVAVAKR